MSTTETADRLAITELFARLAHLLDDNRPEDAHTVYTEDVAVHSPRGGDLHGIDEVTAFLRRSPMATEETHHLNSDIQITLTGDRAQVSANQLVFVYRAGEPPHQTSGLRLNYQATRTPAGWRFHKADITRRWALTSPSPAVAWRLPATPGRAGR